MKMASSLVCTARQTAICKLVFMLCFTPPRMKTGRSPIALGAGWDVAFKRGQSDWPAPPHTGAIFTSDTKSPGHKARRRQRLQHPFFAVIARPRGAEAIAHLQETVSPSLRSGLRLLYYSETVPLVMARAAAQSNPLGSHNGGDYFAFGWQ